MKKLLMSLGMLLLAGGQTTQLSATEPGYFTPSSTTHTKAYAVADVYGTNPTLGIVLHLHDCRGLEADKGWQREWLDYLKLNGFVVIAIDSLADMRPPPVACSGDPWNTHAKSLIYSVRAQQAEYAVKMIRKKHPGKKVFVWGHGEGGVTAQIMKAKIDGVISTGTPCPDIWLEGVAQTPLIIIQGTNDATLQESKKNPLYGSLDGRCKMLMTQPKWEWLTVEGMGHAAELSRKDVKRRITKFLGIPHSK